MKELRIKKSKADKKELENWIIRNYDNDIGFITIDGSTISSLDWGVLKKEIGPDLKNEIEEYYNTVFFYYYEDIEKGSISKELDVNVLKVAIKRLVDSYPKKTSDDDIMGGISNITIFHVMHKSEVVSHKLFVFPAVWINEYSQNTIWDEEKLMDCLVFTNYLQFFVENIQEYEDRYPDGEDAPPIRMYEGLSVKTYLKKYKGKDIEKQVEIVNWMLHQHELKSIKEEKCDLVLLQRKLELEEKQVSLPNIILLAEFIKEKCESRYFAFLEPTIEDILDAIEKLDGVSRVVFENDKGKKVICEKDEHIKLLKEAFGNKSYTDRRVYKINKIVPWSEIADKTIIQALFVQDMIKFLNNYFPEGRRRTKRSPVSTAEQELICWAMFHVGLSEKKVGDSRFRQLKIFYENSNIDRHPDFHILPKEFEKEIGTRIIALDYLSWEQWQNVNDIDWTRPIKKFVIQIGDVIHF